MYHFLEFLHNVLKSGLSWASAIAAILAWHKWRSSVEQKKINRIMLDDIRAIREAVGGVTWSAAETSFTVSLEKRTLTSSLLGRLNALYAIKFTMRGSQTMKSKWLSRKFILAIAGIVVIILNDILELNINQDTVYTFAGIIATWVAAEAAIDVAKKPEVTSYDKQAFDSVRADSEDAKYTSGR